MIDEEIYRRWAEIDEAGTAGKPWGIEAEILREVAGVSAAEAVNALVLRTLAKGDLTPLCALFAQGVAPGPHVLRYLSRMIEPALGGIRHVNFRIETKSIDGAPGRPREYWMEVRDERIRALVREGLAKGKPYKAVVAEVAEIEGLGVTVHAVKKIAPQGHPENE
jgi:hypothetical protein